MNARNLLTSTLLLTVATACQCGGAGGNKLPDGGVDPNPNVDEAILLALSPVDAVYETDGVTAATGDYTATATYRSGRSEDVTARTSFYSDNLDIGSFTGATFKSTLDRGGKVRVTALFGSIQANTLLTVVLRRSVVDPKSTTCPRTRAASSPAPRSPRARPTSSIRTTACCCRPTWARSRSTSCRATPTTRSSSSRFTNDVTDVQVYMRCATPLDGGCIYDARRDGVARAGRPPTAAARGHAHGARAPTTRARPRASARAPASSCAWLLQRRHPGRPLLLDDDDATAIMRCDFAVTHADGRRRSSSDAATVGGGTNCIGCHALSRDGTEDGHRGAGLDRRPRAADGRGQAQPDGRPSPPPNKSFF